LLLPLLPWQCSFSVSVGLLLITCLSVAIPFHLPRSQACMTHLKPQYLSSPQVVHILLPVCPGTASAQTEGEMGCETWLPSSQGDSPRIELNGSPSDLSFHPNMGLNEDSGTGEGNGRIPPSTWSSALFSSALGSIRQLARASTSKTCLLLQGSATHTYWTPAGVKFKICVRTSECRRRRAPTC